MRTIGGGGAGGVLTAWSVDFLILLAEGFGVTRTRTFAPANVRFRGMPNARFWDFESSRSDLGDLTVDLRELGLFAVMDFAVVHGHDGFMVPRPMHVGTACRVDSIRVQDVFGEVTTVRGAEESSRGGSMLSTTAPGELASVRRRMVSRWIDGSLHVWTPRVERRPHRTNGLGAW